MSGSKYNAQKCVEDGFKFDSMLERDVYLQLKRLRDRGAIAEIRLQHSFDLLSNNGIKIGRYIADFYCILPDGKAIVVEPKGVRTTIWMRTKKHFQADYPHLTLIEVRDRNLFPLNTLEDLYAIIAAPARSPRKKRSKLKVEKVVKASAFASRPTGRKSGR